MNKNVEVLFCVIGVDNVFEYKNCFMKVFGGLVGIILNEVVWMKFFLIVLEFVSLVE